MISPLAYNSILPIKRGLGVNRCLREKLRGGGGRSLVNNRCFIDWRDETPKPVSEYPCFYQRQRQKNDEPWQCEPWYFFFGTNTNDLPIMKIFCILPAVPRRSASIFDFLHCCVRLSHTNCTRMTAFVDTGFVTGLLIFQQLFRWYCSSLSSTGRSKFHLSLSYWLSTITRVNRFRNGFPILRRPDDGLYRHYFQSTRWIHHWNNIPIPIKDSRCLQESPATRCR